MRKKTDPGWLFARPVHHTRWVQGAERLIKTTYRGVWLDELGSEHLCPHDGHLTPKTAGVCAFNCALDKNQSQ